MKKTKGYNEHFLLAVQKGDLERIKNIARKLDYSVIDVINGCLLMSEYKLAKRMPELFGVGRIIAPSVDPFLFLREASKGKIDSFKLVWNDPEFNAQRGSAEHSTYSKDLARFVAYDLLLIGRRPDFATYVFEQEPSILNKLDFILSVICAARVQGRYRGEPYGGGYDDDVTLRDIREWLLMVNKDWLATLGSPEKHQKLLPSPSCFSPFAPGSREYLAAQSEYERSFAPDYTPPAYDRGHPLPSGSMDRPGWRYVRGPLPTYLLSPQQRQSVAEGHSVPKGYYWERQVQ